ncbi:MAG: hypothetical protein EOM43_18630 [Gammaproteobacteria bacterium]|nr:hypothetical protein [Gammaproteobacteria bacterium]
MVHPILHIVRSKRGTVCYSLPPVPMAALEIISGNWTPIWRELVVGQWSFVEWINPNAETTDSFSNTVLVDIVKSWLEDIYPHEIPAIMTIGDELVIGDLVLNLRDDRGWSDLVEYMEADVAYPGIHKQWLSQFGTWVDDFSHEAGQSPEVTIGQGKASIRTRFGELSVPVHPVVNPHDRQRFLEMAKMLVGSGLMAYAPPLRWHGYGTPVAYMLSAARKQE